MHVIQIKLYALTSDIYEIKAQFTAVHSLVYNVVVHLYNASTYYYNIGIVEIARILISSSRS